MQVGTLHAGALHSFALSPLGALGLWVVRCALLLHFQLDGNDAYQIIPAYIFFCFGITNLRYFFHPKRICLILIINKAEVHSDIKTYVYLLSNNLRAILHAVNRCTIHGLFFTKI